MEIFISPLLDLLTQNQSVHAILGDLFPALRLRRWPKIKTKLGQRLVSAGRQHVIS